LTFDIIGMVIGPPLDPGGALKADKDR
jgi:hypothetical protein